MCDPESVLLRERSTLEPHDCSPDRKGCFMSFAPRVPDLYFALL